MCCQGTRRGHCAHLWEGSGLPHLLAEPHHPGEEHAVWLFADTGMLPAATFGSTVLKVPSRRPVDLTVSTEQLVIVAVLVGRAPCSHRGLPCAYWDPGEGACLVERKVCSPLTCSSSSADDYLSVQGLPRRGTQHRSAPAIRAMSASTASIVGGDMLRSWGAG